jgi:[acyl-carrier-protein] S-malonyltransferase
VTSGEEVRALCLDQLVRTVMWTTEERALHDAGVDQILEVGPGSVLQGLWKAIGKVDEAWPAEMVRTAGTLEEIEAIAKERS